MTTSKCSNRIATHKKPLRYFVSSAVFCCFNPERDVLAILLVIWLPGGQGQFLSWVSYYGLIHDGPIVGVAPHWTSQRCSGCGRMVKKSLSERTHHCVHYGLILDRDENAARVRRFGACKILS